MPPSIQAWLDNSSITMDTVVWNIDHGILSVDAYAMAWAPAFTADELRVAIAVWKLQQHIRSYNANAAPVMKATGTSVIMTDPNSSLNPWGHDPMNVVAEVPVDHLMEHVEHDAYGHLIAIRAESWPDTIRMDYAFLRDVDDGDVGMIAGKPVAYIIRDKKLVFDYTNGYAEYVLGDELPNRNATEMHRIYLREK